MLLVIFGAGASYDSVAGPLTPQEAYPATLSRPPLANELFNRRFGDDIALFPRCQPVIPYLQKPGANIEGELEKLQNEVPEYKERSRQLAAIRYYLQTMLSRCLTRWATVTKGVTNYKTLLDEIEHRRPSTEHVCLVTFNYDTLLEEALPTIHVNIESMSDYIRSDYRVIKLHGSVNWAHEVTSFGDVTNQDPRLTVSEVIELIPEVEFTKGFKVIPPDPLIQQRSNAPLFPALSIPVENKPGYECPPEHLEALEKCWPGVTKVLVIGWRAAETRFLKTLAEKLLKATPMMVVSSSQAKAAEVIERMRIAGVDAKFVAAKGGFSDTIISHEADNFLKI